jgi:hypothetical protein
MILFLDFDGVLHPDPCFVEANLFEHAPRLADTLAPFPEVAVVLSTSWRTMRTLDQLIAPLPSSLRERVIDVTPPFSLSATPASLVPYRRQAECMQWLRDSGEEQRPWLALDDRASLFAPYCEQLVLCESPQGLNEAIATRLTGLLLRARQRFLQHVDALL